MGEGIALADRGDQQRYARIRLQMSRVAGKMECDDQRAQRLVPRQATREAKGAPDPSSVPSVAWVASAISARIMP